MVSVWYYFNYIKKNLTLLKINMMRFLIVEQRGVKSNYFGVDLIKMNRCLSLKYEGY